MRICTSVSASRQALRPLDKPQCGALKQLACYQWTAKGNTGMGRGNKIQLAMVAVAGPTQPTAILPQGAKLNSNVCAAKALGHHHVPSTHSTRHHQVRESQARPGTGLCHPAPSELGSPCCCAWGVPLAATICGADWHIASPECWTCPVVRLPSCRLSRCEMGGRDAPVLQGPADGMDDSSFMGMTPCPAAAA
mmetsp:Transcript_13406/g.28676  ORF Transcript_13406/g.28676 Transcript_13406/m.28676 type:complete len:193 (-) Transcript_13406:1546-2124(-)